MSRGQTYVEVAALRQLLGAPVSDLWLQALRTAYPWIHVESDLAPTVRTDGAGRHWIGTSDRPTDQIARLTAVRAVMVSSLFPRMIERSVDLPDGHVLVPGVDNPNGLRTLAAVLCRQACADGIDVQEKLPADLRALLEDVLAVDAGLPSGPPHTV